MHRVQVSDAVKGYINLPDGGTYRRNQIATLTDAEFALVPVMDLIYVLDLGGTPDVPAPPPPSGIRDLTSETNARIAADDVLAGRCTNLEQGVSVPYVRGVATLAGGTVTVFITNVNTNSRIFLTAQALGTVSRPQALAVTATVPGVSFTVTSADATDTSVVGYLIIDPIIL